MSKLKCLLAIVVVALLFLTVPIGTQAQQVQPYPFVPVQPPFPLYPVNPGMQPGVQQPTPQPLVNQAAILGMDIVPVQMREKLSFKDESWSTQFQKTRFELGASATIPDLLNIRFSMLPGLTTSETVTRNTTTRVGLTEFEKDKPLTFTFKEDTSFRIGVSIPIKFPLKPVVIAEFPNFTITASATKDGKTIEDEETFKKLVGGIGGMLEYRNNNLNVEVLGVASNCYSLIQGVFYTRIADGVDVGLGGFWKQISLDGFKWNASGPYGGLRATF